jgi:penicillin-binding protein-related factor A (putative recombinase)
LAKKNEGKLFEEDFQNSAKKQNIFVHRIKDINLPFDLRSRVKLPQNQYDSILFYNGWLLPIEFKSTKSKSISFSESIIKEHQIQSLKDATEYEKVIPGFIFNFREPDNETFFIHIDEFVKYKNIAENQLDHTYESKINKSSIPMAICKEIGIEIENEKKRTRYFYDVMDFINKAASQVEDNLKKGKRSNLFSSTTPERLEMINDKSKKNGGLSNLTYGRVFGEDVK